MFAYEGVRSLSLVLSLTLDNHIATMKESMNHYYIANEFQANVSSSLVSKLAFYS